MIRSATDSRPTVTDTTIFAGRAIWSNQTLHPERDSPAKPLTITPELTLKTADRLLSAAYPEAIGIAVPASGHAANVPHEQDYPILVSAVQSCT